MNFLCSTSLSPSNHEKLFFVGRSSHHLIERKLLLQPEAFHIMIQHVRLRKYKSSLIEITNISGVCVCLI